MVERELIKSDNDDIIIYNSDISMLEEEYIESLYNPEMIFKVSVFNGLLNLIHERLLKDLIRFQNNYINYQICNDIFFKIYIPLCNKYNIVPSVINFTSTVLRIDNTLITDIRNGNYRSDGSNVNKLTIQLVKNWFNVCESAYVQSVSNNNSVGCMFLLKSLYKYSDNNPIQVEIARIEDHDTPEQIAARHKTAFIPEKPNID
jgi:hypothetical protein